MTSEKTVDRVFIQDTHPKLGVGFSALNPFHGVIYLALVVSLIILVAPYDLPIAQYFRGGAFSHWITHGFVNQFLRLPGEYWLALATALLLWKFHPQTWRAAGLMLLSGLAGAINGVIKWVAGRPRPFTWGDGPWHWDYFHEGIYGFFHQQNLSFTSGHTTQAFAWAEVVSIAAPRWRLLAFAWATGTALHRVASTAHWTTDVVAGAWLGVVTVRVSFRILARIVPPARYEAAPAGEAGTSRAELTTMQTPTIDLAPGAPGPYSGPYLSLVIPCYNEEENVPTLLQRVEASMQTLGRPYEVLIIDDGSTDGTPAMLASAAARLPWLRIIRMGKNCGQSAGFEAGFSAARGEYIATIDADLQNDPEEVPRLAKLLDENPAVDMITGWRKDRQDTNFRRWQSRQANKIRNYISQDDINDSASSLKIYRSPTLKGMKLFNGAHRFFPTLVKMRGFTVMETPVKHSQRFAGTAKYGFSNRALRAFIDLLGVRWMKMRYLRYSCAEISGNGISSAAAGNGYDASREPVHASVRPARRPSDAATP